MVRVNIKQKDYINLIKNYSSEVGFSKGVFYLQDESKVVNEHALLCKSVGRNEVKKFHSYNKLLTLMQSSSLWIN